MMLQKLRDWAKNRSASNAPMTTQQAQDAAQENRESRASYVTDLQAQVRSLQQEITNLAAAPEDGIGSKGPQGDQDQLAVLEQELEEKQRELARFQGRI